ncbi:kynureninase [Embleya sp. NPDC050493]|uniref:kynureninase n=1 Tax=Embleya sp. NPDC050493 TaxID=3363989 RepID=UPI0037B075EC
MPTTRTDAERLDADDVLAGFRERFTLPPGLIYLDGNSLGPLPTSVAPAVHDAIHRQWRENLVRSWVDWMELPTRVGDRIGALLGVGPGQVAVGDSTSVQLFNTLVGAARLRPGRQVLLTDPRHFPTDRYMADSAARLLGLRVVEVPAEEAAEWLARDGRDVAVAAYPVVDYRTGELWDVAGITAAAHEVGAVVLWDVCHAVGVLPLDLERHDVDMAVGCTYKYLSGGPGSPAFVYVAERHHQALDLPLAGWLGHATPFATGGPYVPAAGIGRAVVGTPAILSLVALDAALDVYRDVSVEQVRAKSLSLTAFFVRCVDELPDEPGFEVVTPRAAERRGSHVSLRHEHAYGMIRALMPEGVVADSRPPDLLRFGFHPLYVSHQDVQESVERLRWVTETKQYTDPRFARTSAFG